MNCVYDNKIWLPSNNIFELFDSNYFIDHYDEMEKQLDDVDVSIPKDLEEEGKFELQMRMSCYLV